MKTSIPGSPDDSLLARLKQREEQAFLQLYDQYGPLLYGVILKVIRDPETAEDLLQDSFIKVWRYIDYHDPRKGSLFTWLLNVARNTAIDALRANRKFSPARLDEVMLPVVEQQNYTIQPRADTFDLPGWVHLLRPERQVLIELIYFQGYSHSEAAHLLGLPIGTVKTRLRAALLELKLRVGDPN